MAFKLCRFRRDIERQRLEIIDHLLNTLQRAYTFELKLPPEILKQVTVEIGVKSNDLEELKRLYQRTLQEGSEKWKSLETKLKKQHAQLEEELKTPSFALEDSEFTTTLFTMELDDIDQLIKTQLQDIKDTLTSLHVDYKKEVKATSEQWQPYQLLLDNLNTYYTLKREELEKFKTLQLTSISSLTMPETLLVPIPDTLCVKWNNATQLIPSHGDETVALFLKRTLNYFRLDHYDIRYFQLFILGGSVLKPAHVLKDYSLTPATYLKLLYIQ